MRCARCAVLLLYQRGSGRSQLACTCCRYTDLHNKFLEFFEAKIEAVITKVRQYHPTHCLCCHSRLLSCAWYMQNGSDVRTFYRILKERSIADPDGDDSMFIQIMLAVVEFDVFMQMMKEAKIAKDAQASHK